MTKKKVTLTDVYLEAAKMVDGSESDFASCCAVKYSARQLLSCTAPMLWPLQVSAARRLYNEVFNPFVVDAAELGVNADPNGLRWFGLIHKRKDRRQLRVLMLCLMQACWEDFK